jgi:hypothetical protein
MWNTMGIMLPNKLNPLNIFLVEEFAKLLDQKSIIL